MVYVVDLTDDPEAVLATVRDEVAAYDPELAARPSLVVGTKADLLVKPWVEPPPEVDLVVSAIRGEGMSSLAERLSHLVGVARAEEPDRTAFVVLRPGRETFTVKQEGGRFRVSGRRVERWVAETDLQDPRQVIGLQRRLIRAGVERKLAELGARRGDEVVIGEVPFQFIPGGEEAGERPMQHTGPDGHKGRTLRGGGRSVGQGCGPCARGVR